MRDHIDIVRRRVDGSRARLHVLSGALLVVVLWSSACSDDNTGNPGEISNQTSNGTSATSNATSGTTGGTTGGATGGTTGGTTGATTGPECEEGERRCGGQDRVEICEEGAWSEAFCSDGWRCESGQCAPPPQVCDNGEVRCLNSNTAERCVDGGTRWVAEPCAPDLACEMGLCAPVVVCEANTSRCLEDGQVERCSEDGTELLTAPCDEGEACQEGACAPIPICEPGASVCTEGGQLGVCSEDGATIEQPMDCPGETDVCSAGECLTLCEATARGLVAGGPTHLGCEFWSPLLEGSPIQAPGFALTNPNPFEVQFTVYDYTHEPEDAVAEAGVGEERVRSEVLDAEGEVVEALDGVLEAIALPPGGSAVVLVQRKRVLGFNSALRIGRVNTWQIVSSHPIGASQFGPLCCAGVNDSDSSLLLPKQRDTLRQRIVAPSNGYVTIVATEDNTEIRVELPTRELADPTPQVTPDNTGAINIGPGTFNAFDQLHLQVDRNNDRDALDLSGGLIISNRPVMVFGGHVSSYVPFSTITSDHLQEQIPPMNAWGTRSVVGVTRWRSEDLTAEGVEERNYVKLVAGDDPVRFTFTPPLSEVADAGPYSDSGEVDCRALAEAEGGATLDAGGVCVFGTRDDLVIDGDAPFLAAQLITSSRTTDAALSGDPTFMVVPAVEHHVTEARFHASPVAEASYVTLVTPPGNPILLDGQPIEPLEEVTVTDDWSRVTVSVSPGTHRIESADGVEFGAIVYGYAVEASFGHPIGLALPRAR